MSLRDTLISATNAAFDVVGDVKQSVSYLQNFGTTYDPATGNESTNTINTFIVDAIISSFSVKEVDGTNYLESDQEALILVADLPTATTKDSVTIGTKNWRVIGVQQDPARVVWTLHLRASNE